MPGDLWLWLQHWDDLIGCYERQCGAGTRPPMVPEWYWRGVVLVGDDDLAADLLSDVLSGVIDLRTLTPCIPNHG